MTTTITVESPIRETPRVAQVRGRFDLPLADRSTMHWTVDLPLDARPWQIGLVVGPSGCGKSTIARRLWPDALDASAALAHLDRGSVLDAFPDDWGIADIVELLSSVGFASPPAWLRPYRVLSTGEQFRVTLALRLASAPEGGLVVCDEYTSTVDRTVAQIGSHALARTIRASAKKYSSRSARWILDEQGREEVISRSEMSTFGPDVVARSPCKRSRPLDPFLRPSRRLPLPGACKLLSPPPGP